ncbi:MAG: hypothetical protein AAGI49_14260 [Bacteroidota bacterium]
MKLEPLKIDLEEIKKGLPGFTPTAASYIAEAASYCLYKSGHDSGVFLLLDEEQRVKIQWNMELSEDLETTWQDEQELVEFAAVGIALPLALLLTSYTDIQRAEKGSRADFWLGRKDENGFPILEALLEVSGIYKENAGNTLKTRVKRKTQQIKKTPYGNLTCYVIVIEFSQPKGKFLKL